MRTKHMRVAPLLCNLYIFLSRSIVLCCIVMTYYEIVFLKSYKKKKKRYTNNTLHFEQLNVITMLLILHSFIIIRCISYYRMFGLIGDVCFQILHCLLVSSSLSQVILYCKYMNSNQYFC